MIVIVYFAIFMTLLGALFLFLFFYGLRKGQFDDLKTPAHRMLLDDDEVVSKSEPVKLDKN